MNFKKRKILEKIVNVLFSIENIPQFKSFSRWVEQLERINLIDFDDAMLIGTLKEKHLEGMQRIGLVKDGLANDADLFGGA